MKTAIFGGSFNPPHRMHARLLNAALERVERVVLVPTGDAYPKEGLLPCEQRLAMLELMFGGREDVFISAEECRAAAQVYTWQTMQAWQERLPQDQLFFLCGSDNIRDLPNWREYEVLLERYVFLVAGREDDLPALIAQVMHAHPQAAGIIDLNVPPDALSSTAIRALIRQADWQALEGALAPAVLHYVQCEGLYT